MATTKKTKTNTKRPIAVKMKTTRPTARSRTAKSVVKITTYTSALKWLNEHTDYERLRMVKYDSKTFSLDRMKNLLDHLGNPQAKLKTVHIAGSKGKGSTCAMLQSMLIECGYTVGLFTSPHLIDIRERITINNQLIDQHDMADIFKRIKKVVNSMPQRPSFFEILTACAAVHFAEQAVDIAIFETGLGGRLDATNVLTPLVCGITQISLDHMNILGKELTTIAAEKAGIMKKGIPVITVKQDPAVTKLFQEFAQKTGADLQITGIDIDFSMRFEASRELGPHTRICITTPNARYDHLAVPLHGEHQALNCGLALAILDKLSTFGFNIPEEKIADGLANTNIAGRMETVWQQPQIILDGAHNAASLKALIKAIGAHIKYDSLVIVFGCASDKDIDGLLYQLSLGADKVIFTRARSNPRAIDPDELKHHFSDISDKMAQVAPNLKEALELAVRAVSRDDIICVTGSFYLVGEAKKYLRDLKEKRIAAAVKA